MAKAKDLRDQTLDELQAAYQDACKQLFFLRNEFRAEKKKEKPHRLNLAKKDIARLLTVMTEKKAQQK